MSKSDRNRPRVRRITIDERLDENLLKIAVADLLPDREDLSGDPLDAWTEEAVQLIDRSGFLPAFELDAGDPVLETLAGVRPAEEGSEDRVGAFWRSLEEGQVFLVGEIAIEGADSKAPEAIFARPGTPTVLRIDRIEEIKERHKRLYSKALREGR